MKILNYLLVGTAAIAFTTSSTLAMVTVVPKISGNLRIIPSAPIYKYDEIRLSRDKVNYSDSLFLGDIEFSEKNGYYNSIDIFAINKSENPTGGKFAISTKVTDVSVAKYINVNLMEISERDGSEKLLYSGTLASMAYNPPLLDIAIYRKSPTRFKLDTFTPTNLRNKYSTTFEMSITPMKDVPISSPIM